VCNDGFVGKLYAGDRGTGGKKLLVASESKITYLLMVSMLMLTVQRIAAAASAYWVGIWQEGNGFCVNLYYSYCLPLHVKSCCTSPDWMGQEDPAGEEELADMH
jgi:hypothetical protein